jgi:hypothetical protein
MKHLISICLTLISLCTFAQTKSTLYVADRFALCDTNECIQVKAKKSAAWQATAAVITGFTYEEGYEYKLKISTDKLTGKQTLVKVLSKKSTGYNPAVKLEGKKWVVYNLYDGGTNMWLRDTSVYIMLDVTNGKVTGHGVCNRFKGTLNALGKNITIGELAFTKMRCLDQGNVMESIINNLLMAAKTYEVKGKQLTLYSDKDSHVVLRQY